MNKRELIKQKTKLKQIYSIKYLHYAKYACLLLIIMFLIYVGGASTFMNKPLEELLSKNPVVIVGFIISAANLYIWYVLKNFIADIQKLEHIESIRINLILMAIGQFILLNYIAAILMLISLKKYFHWNQFSLKKSLTEIRKEGQIAVASITLIVLILFISLVYGIYISISKK